MAIAGGEGDGAADSRGRAAAPCAARPPLRGISFLHRFGLALDQHVHLNACATDGIFMPLASVMPAFIPAQPTTQADLAALSRKMRSHVIRWFRLDGLHDAAAAADMLAGENSGLRSTLFVGTPRTSPAVSRTAHLRTGAALRDPRSGRSHHARPLRAHPGHHDDRRQPLRDVRWRAHGKAFAWGRCRPGESFDAERITILGTRTLNPNGAAYLLGHDGIGCHEPATFPGRA
jgi:hypothetical protein